MPFVARYKVEKNPKDSSPLRCLPTVSCIVGAKASYTLSGISCSRKDTILGSSSGMGIYGISVKTKIVAGKMARVKLKANP